MSQGYWDTYTVYFDIALQGDYAIPSEWVISILDAKDTWNSVVPSQFLFIRQIGSPNKITYEMPDNQHVLAVSAPPVTGVVTSGYIKINPSPTILWDTNNTPSSNDPDHNGSTNTYNIQNLITHEFGHWLILIDINDSSCIQVTMDHDIGFGEINKISLDTADENGLNWQYP